jgi:hypothetical protein
MRSTDDLVDDVFTILDSEQTSVAEASAKVFVAAFPRVHGTPAVLGMRGLAATVNEFLHPRSERATERTSESDPAPGGSLRPNTPRISRDAYAAADEWWAERYENANRQNVPLAEFTREDLDHFIGWNRARRDGHDRNLRLAEKAIAAMDERGAKTVGALPKAVLFEIGEA